jgi:lipoprotein-anchoring transpeptidase ErfK/SrfK
MNQSATSLSSKTGSSQFAKFTFWLAALALSANSLAAQTSPISEAKPRLQASRRIVVSVPDRKLALLEDGRVVKIYDVAVGAPVSPSPTGEFQIAQRLVNPTFYKPGVVIGPGQGNPLGTRWMGLSVKGFGIHGTNRPDSIGKKASHGCIRLRNSDVEDLFARVQVGDRVSLIAKRTDEVARLFGAAPGLGDAYESVQASNESTASREGEAHGDR